MMLEDMALLLQQANIGVIGTNIFLSNMPASPDACVALYEYAGNARERSFGGDVLESPGLQVRVRNTTYSAARTKIESVIAALDGVNNTTVNNKRYLSVLVQQSPTPMGSDQNGRKEFTVNFIVQKER